MARREQLINDAVTELNGAITAAATTITVANGGVFPTEGDFRIIVNDEIMLVTARSTNDLTVVRGQDGTTGAIQADGAVVRAIVTAGGLNQWMDDITAGYSDRYPHRFLDDTGTTLTSSSFSWTNQSTASVSDDPWGGVTMQAPAVASYNWRILTMSAPTAPWKLTGHLQFGPGYHYFDTTGSIMAICARESSSGKLQSVALRIGQNVAAWQWTNPTTFFGTLGTAFSHRTDHVWVQLEDNNTNIIARCSADGINWFNLGSEARGAFPTGAAMNEVGFMVDSDNANANAFFHFTSWILE